LGAPKIRELDLKSNKIREFRVNSNVKLGSLRRLELGSNRIDDISMRKILENVEIGKIKVIGLEGNRLNDVETLIAMMHKVRRTLKIIKADANNIHGHLNIDFPLTILKSLSLSRNSLLTFTLASELPSLTMLDLSYNHIHSLRHDGRTFLPRLNELHIRRNMLT
jgi:Leucine-rich repeat (LRR) protein